MTIRDTRQEEFADVFIQRKTNGILYLCPRFGKCRVAIRIFKTYGATPKILISYPDSKIKQSWLDEFELLGYKNPNLVFTTHLSLNKHTAEKWDLVVLDEIHLMSEAQIEAGKELNTDILGLTGTMTSWTENTLKRELKLPVLARYPISQAIEEGVITDYEIIVKKVPLDKVEKTYKNNTRSEKKQFDAYSYIIDKIEEENEKLKNDQMMGKRINEDFKDPFLLRLNRMRIIQNSLAKLNYTKKLLQDFKDERVLVFCGLTKIADAIGCPVYHSKKGELQVFEDFANGIGNHIVVCKLGNTGVTYKPLNKVIINYFDSNGENLSQKILRCMAMEYDNKQKKAIIYIISSDEPVEAKWLKSALEFFDKEKIKYE